MSFNLDAYFLAKALNLNASGHTGATSSSLPPIVIHSSDYFTNPDYLKPKKMDNTDAHPPVPKQSTPQKIDNSRSPSSRKAISKRARSILKAMLKDSRDDGDSVDEYDSDSSIEMDSTPQATLVPRLPPFTFNLPTTSNCAQQNHQNVNSSQAHHQSPPAFHASHQSSYSPTSSVPSTDSPTLDVSTGKKPRQKRIDMEQLRALEDLLPVKKLYTREEYATVWKELKLNAAQVKYWARKKRMEMENEEKENEQ